MASNLLQRVDPALLVFVTFLITCGSSQLYAAATTRRGRLPIKSVGDVIVLNVSTASGWILFFYALKYLEPAIVTSITTSMGPISTLLVDRAFRRRITTPRPILYTSLGILLVMFYLMWVAYSGQSAMGIGDRRAIWFGLFGSLLTGTSVVFTTVYTKRLYDKGWVPAKVMSHRFYCLVIVSAILAADVDTPLTVLASSWKPVLLIALLGVTLPIYILQLGIVRCTPVVVAAILSIGPLVTMLFERLDDRLVASQATMWGVFLLGGLVVGNVLYSKDQL